MIDRRDLLRLSVASATTLWLPRSAWSHPRLKDNPFTLGVASGSPLDTSVVLWTRLAPDDDDALGSSPVTVRWEIAHDEAFQRIVQHGQAQAVHELAHSVHVEADGLEPDRWYFYRFMAGDFTSRIGRTRTLPAADAIVQKLRIGYASCQRWEHGYFSAWRHLREENPDLVLFLGDYIYEYPGSPTSVRMPQGLWAISLEGYRKRHAQYKGDADLQAMHAACPWLLTWDDHEVQNDYAGIVAGNGGPSIEHLPRRAAAYQAYYEHMPLRASVLTRGLAGLAAGAQLRIHSQQRFGRLANLVMLDTRQHRDQQACTNGGRTGSSRVVPDTCASWNDPQRTMLGAAQERWLDAQLAQTQPAQSAHPGWTVLGQSTLFGRQDLRPGAGGQLWNDGWDGYAAARTRLTQSLQRHDVKNAVLLGGDVHENWVGHVKADYARPQGESIAVEFCGTSVTSRPGEPRTLDARLAGNPHFLFADAKHRGYGVVDFTPQRLTVRLRALADAEKKDSAISTLASFAVQADVPRVERA